MAPGLTRSFYDLHHGDFAGRLRRLERLYPLLQWVDHPMLNGDTGDPRPLVQPPHSARCREELFAFCAKRGIRPRPVTGKHDPNLSSCHLLELAHGEVCVVHGDVLYPSLVPWSHDAPAVRRRMREELRRAAPGIRGSLANWKAIFRRVSASTPQRYPAGSPAWGALLGFLADTARPPQRGALIVHSWLVLPARSAHLGARHRPAPRFIVTDCTQYLGCCRPGKGQEVISTGSFTLPSLRWR